MLLKYVVFMFHFSAVAVLVHAVVAAVVFVAVVAAVELISAFCCLFALRCLIGQFSLFNPLSKNNEQARCCRRLGRRCYCYFLNEYIL